MAGIVYELALVFLNLYTSSNLILETRSHMMGMPGGVVVILGQHLRWMQGSNGVSVEGFDL